MIFSPIIVSYLCQIIDKIKKKLNFFIKVAYTNSSFIFFCFNALIFKGVFLLSLPFSLRFDIICSILGRFSKG